MLALLAALTLSQFCYVTSDRSVCNLTTVKCGSGMSCSVGPNRALNLTSTGGGGITGNTCGAGTYAYEIDALGILTCNTVSVASTATALAANPTDCAAGQFANAIAASGNLTCATPSQYVNFITFTITGAQVAAVAGGVGTYQWEHLNQGIPAKARVTRVVIDVTQGFDDGAGPMATSNLLCGNVSGGGQFMSSFSIFTPSVRGDGNAEVTATIGSILDWSAGTDFWCQWSCSGALLSALTSGSATFYIEYILYP